MSVHEAEPNVPNDDNGKGLRMIGWILLIWTGISLVWVPPNQWVNHRFMPVVDAACFIAGLVFVVTGYVVAWRTPPERVLNERAHDLIAASEDGADQHDETS